MNKLLTLALLSIILVACSGDKQVHEPGLTTVLFDTDTNNELDDQHALAYLLFNGKTFDLAGVTVNATRGGGRIEGQYAEAERVMRLCGFDKVLPLYKGANSSFDSINQNLDTAMFDGSEAVNVIIQRAQKPAPRKLTVIAVGKLTNIALALRKAPAIESRIRLVWLGSNYPEPGEYNLDNDTASLSYVLKTNVEFEIVTVRYGKSNGSDVVRLTKDDVTKNMKGRGPVISTPVEGRHGGSFNNFGDYSVNLFEHIQYNGNPPSRALFDMVAVAIVKNPAWGKKVEIPGPKFVNNQWIEQPNNARKISVWGDFDKERITADFYETMEKYRVVSQ